MCYDLVLIKQGFNAREFVPESMADERGNFFVARSAAQKGLDIIFVLAEHARDDFPACGHPNSVAISAKRSSHGSDDADVAANSVGETVNLSR